MTLCRALDILLAATCFVMATLQSHQLIRVMWIDSGLFCAASAYWCWADRMNVWLKRRMARTVLGYALRLRVSRL